MKRLIAFLGVALVLLGVRFFDSGIYRITGGELTVFNQAAQTPEIFIPTGADTYRIDLAPDTDIYKLLDDCSATILFCEDILSGQIIYAYSPLVPRSEWIHGKRINIMVFIGKEQISVGVPILKGSY